MKLKRAVNDLLVVTSLTNDEREVLAFLGAKRLGSDEEKKLHHCYWWDFGNEHVEVYRIPFSKGDKNHEQLSLDDAWQLALRAYRNGTYGAREEFDRLPPIIQKIVGSPSYIHYVAMGNRRCLDREYERFEREYIRLCDKNVADFTVFSA